MPATPALTWHAAAAATVVESLQTDARAGLAGSEASARLTQHGPNELPEATHKPLWKVFASQFASPLIYILFVAAVISSEMLTDSSFALRSTNSLLNISSIRTKLLGAPTSIAFESVATDG